MKRQRLRPIHQALLQRSELDLQQDGPMASEINAQDAFGRSPLLMAVLQDDLANVHTLLEYGADVSLMDAEGRSVFH